jgi:uncharacterized NAD(P)/FAD-binding protein YdhS
MEGDSMDIAIVGAGPTGIINAISLCNSSYASQVRLHIFEPGKPCYGRSMNTGTNSMRLNTSLAVTFIDPANEHNFYDYAYAKDRTIKPEDVVPRELFAEYLRAQFSQAQKKLKSCEIINQTATNISTKNDRFLIIATPQEQRQYDAVIIATGLPFRERLTEDQQQPVISPYPSNSLQGLDRHIPVLVLGSRLSAVDTLVQLSEQKHQGPITLHSRSGYFPSVRREMLRTEGQPFLAMYHQTTSRLPEGYSKVDCLVKLFMQYVQRNGEMLTDMIITDRRNSAAQLHHDVQTCKNNQNTWQPIAIDIIDAMNELLPTLNISSKAKFMADVQPWLGRLTHSMPLRNAEVIDNLFASGQLRALSRDEYLTRNMKTDTVIVNATGLGSAEHDPLLTHLSKSGLINFNGLGGLATNSISCRLNAQYPLYGNGAILQGEVYTASSIYSSSYGAQKITNDIARLIS